MKSWTDKNKARKKQLWQLWNLGKLTPRQARELENLESRFMEYIKSREPYAPSDNQKQVVKILNLSESTHPEKSLDNEVWWAGAFLYVNLEEKDSRFGKFKKFMKTNIGQRIDAFIIRKLGNKAGHAYKVANDWCNGHMLLLSLSAIFLIAILIILNMQHIK